VLTTAEEEVFVRQVVCNHCKTEAPLEPVYGLPPNGWYSVRKQGAAGNPADYCTLACVVAAFTAEQVAALPPAE
jgi:hypothetical protein